MSRIVHPLVQKLMAHPSWKADLNSNKYAIHQEGENSFNLTYMAEGKLRAVNFQINIKEDEYQFQNGQPHHCKQLDQLIQEIFENSHT